MKKILLFSFIIFFNLTVINARDYLVYTVKGDITVNNNEKVVPGCTLKSTDKLSIPTDSRLVILDESSKVLYTLKTPSTKTLEEIIKNEGNTTQQLTDSYLTFIKQKITGINKNQDKNHMQAAGTSYRGEDSLLLNVIVPVN